MIHVKCYNDEIPIKNVQINVVCVHLVAVAVHYGILFYYDCEFLMRWRRWKVVNKERKNKVSH